MGLKVCFRGVQGVVFSPTDRLVGWGGGSLEIWSAVAVCTTAVYNLEVWCRVIRREELLEEWAHPDKAPEDFLRAANMKVPWECGKPQSGNRHLQRTTDKLAFASFARLPTLQDGFLSQKIAKSN
jgi:hypothetical protein